MVITRTPYRLSLFGGGTDYPAWFREHGGAVLASSIDRYCYLTCRYLPPFFEHRSRIVYSKVEYVRSNSEIEHPAVRAVLAMLGMDDGVEIHHDGDLPARTGIGSSSAFTVGLIHALRALEGQMPTRTELATDAIHIEQEVLRETVGCQDQIVSAVGGVVRIDVDPTGAWRVSPLVVSPHRLALLQQHLMLFFTGFARTASDIAAEQIRRLPSLTRDMHEIQAFVPEAQRVICGDGSLTDVGRLLGESWQIKRTLTPRVSTPAIDEMYDAARQAGAHGGKLMGAGGGGFLLLFVEPDRHATVRAALAGLLEVPFAFDRSGSQLLVFEPEARR
jgi:D-glycero-alpha-D-manno-heptose-7-phosphate kinase